MQCKKTCQNGSNPGAHGIQNRIHLSVGVWGECLPVAATGNQLQAGCILFFGLGSSPQVAEPQIVEASLEVVGHLKCKKKEAA